MPFSAPSYVRFGMQLPAVIAVAAQPRARVARLGDRVTQGLEAGLLTYPVDRIVSTAATFKAESLQTGTANMLKDATP